MDPNEEAFQRFGFEPDDATPAPAVKVKALVDAALRDADQVTGEIARGKRIPRGMTEDLRNHVRKLAGALEPAPAVDPMSDPRVVALVEALRTISRDTYTDNIGDNWPTRAANTARAALAALEARP